MDSIERWLDYTAHNRVVNPEQCCEKTIQNVHSSLLNMYRERIKESNRCLCCRDQPCESGCRCNDPMDESKCEHVTIISLTLNDAVYSRFCLKCKQDFMTRKL